MFIFNMTETFWKLYKIFTRLLSNTALLYIKYFTTPVCVHSFFTMILQEDVNFWPPTFPTQVLFINKKKKKKREQIAYTHVYLIHILMAKST